MSRRVRISDDLSSKYWLTVAGYAAAGLLFLFFFTYGFLSAQGNPQQAYGLGISGGIFYFVFSVAGVVTYPALFKDAAYLRSGRGQWNPEWWKYIGFGVGVPAAILIGTTALSISDLGPVIAVLAHGLTAWVMCLVYLYHRHEHVGVP